MYIGPWQEYVLGKALSQAKVRNESSRQRSRPVTASSDFMGGTAPPVRLPRPDSSLSAPSAVGYERHTLRAHPRQASGRGKAKPSQKGKKQRLAHMQQLYGLSGTTAATPAREGEAREGAGAGAGGGPSGTVAPSAHAGGALGPHTSSSLYSPQERGGRAEAVHAWGGGGGMEAGARLPAVSGGFAVAPMAAGSLEPGPWGGQADHHAPHWASAAEIRLPRVEAQHASAGWVGGGRGGGGGADLSRSGAGGDGFGAHGGQSPSRAGMTPTRRAPYQTTFTPFPQAQPHHAAGEPGAPPSPALQPRSPFGGMRIEPDGHGLRVDARADMRGRGYTHRCAHAHRAPLPAQRLSPRRLRRPSLTGRAAPACAAPRASAPGHCLQAAAARRRTWGHSRPRATSTTRCAHRRRTERSHVPRVAPPPPPLASPTPTTHRAHSPVPGAAPRAGVRTGRESHRVDARAGHAEQPRWADLLAGGRRRGQPAPEANRAAHTRRQWHCGRAAAQPRAGQQRRLACRSAAGRILGAPVAVIKSSALPPARSRGCGASL